MNYQLKSRVELLERLHKVIRNMNHENAYMNWIYLVPDEPSTDDFVSIAEDETDFNDTLTLFMRIFERYSKYEQKGDNMIYTGAILFAGMWLASTLGTICVWFFAECLEQKVANTRSRFRPARRYVYNILHRNLLTTAPIGVIITIVKERRTYYGSIKKSRT